MQVEQERMLLSSCGQEDPLLGFCAFDLIVLYDELLLEHFDCPLLIRLLLLSKHDFSEVTFSKDCEEIEIVKPDFTRLVDLRL